MPQTAGQRQTVNDGDTFTHDGYTFRVTIERDDMTAEPWKEHDGHGVVSEWRALDSKRAGERVLVSDRTRARFYDVPASLELARREGWDAPPYGTGTKREQAARAVEADFARLRAWCTDEWAWVYVGVALLDADGNPTKYRASVGGIESDSGAEYFTKQAYWLAEEVAVEYAAVPKCATCGQVLPDGR